MALLYLDFYMQRFRLAKLRLTLDHFTEKFGDKMGQHIYKKWQRYDGDLVELYTTLDHANQQALADLITDVSKD